LQPTTSTELPFYAAVPLAGLAFVLAEAAAGRSARSGRLRLPEPILGGLAAAGLLLLLRLLGWPLAVPDRGTEVDFLIGLLTTNMGLHLTPKVLRQGLPVFALFLAAGAVLYLAQLVVVLPLAMLTSVGLVRALFALLVRVTDRYYAAVVATAFAAVTTGWGPVAMSFPRRFTDASGPVEPMPAILPLNAFFLFHWLVILAARLVFLLFG
jgi:Na+/glutamate symporter